MRIIVDNLWKENEKIENKSWSAGYSFIFKSNVNVIGVF